MTVELVGPSDNKGAFCWRTLVCVQVWNETLFSNLSFYCWEEMKLQVIFQIRFLQSHFAWGLFIKDVIPKKNWFLPLMPDKLLNEVTCWITPLGARRPLWTAPQFNFQLNVEICSQVRSDCPKFNLFSCALIKRILTITQKRVFKQKTQTFKISNLIFFDN